MALATESDQCSSPSQCKPMLGRRSSASSNSFRLRSPSLNSIRLRRIFDLFDKNGDNYISAHELGQALNLLGLDVDQTELETTVMSYIKPGNDGLDFDDFAALHSSLDEAYFRGDGGEDGGDVSQDMSQQEESDLSEAFKVFDEDGDGYISAKELQTVLGKLGFQEGNEIDRVREMIGSVDRNHDGVIDFFEFKDMMRSTIMVMSS